MLKLFPNKVPLGNLHMHSDFSDGINSMEAMLLESIKIGYRYIAFTDHSGNLEIANPLNQEKFPHYFQKIEKLDKKYPEIKVLKGSEVNILENGDLDLEEKWLKKMEIVIGSIHDNNLSEYDYNKSTERYLVALDNPYLSFIGHPTTRRFAQKEALDLDYAKVFEKAKEKRVALELNVTPDRMDLPVELLKLAKSIGNKIVMNTDSHSIKSLHNMKLGLAHLEKAGMEQSDVLNYLGVEEFLAWFKKS